MARATPGSCTDATTILLAGVGGHGIVLGGDVVAEAAFFAGLEVKKSEIHGLSRRFGSVSCQVRLGTDAHSPLRGRGGVNVLVATEAHEAMRYLPFVVPGGTALINRLWIVSRAGPPAPPASAPSNGHRELPRAAPEDESNVPAPRMVWLAGTDVVHRYECPKCLNMYMVGALAELLPVPERCWARALRRIVPESHYRINLEIFEVGRQAARRRGLAPLERRESG